MHMVWGWTTTGVIRAKPVAMPPGTSSIDNA